MTNHLVAIFGGAVSGAEAAFQLGQRGIASVVFDQNALPYGKIEDGLPKWHTKLRDKEEAGIDEKLQHPLVTFVPKMQLGEHIDFQDIANNWGFSALLLATGAWRDRPLPIAGIDNYIGNGLYYQNPFMYWFNHAHEPEYKGPECSLADGAVVIGGGLASIDVAKVLMISAVQKALAKRGERLHLFELERNLSKVLEDRNLSLKQLGVKGCTIVYRRRIKDMPLFPGPTDTAAQIRKAEIVREKILKHAQSKYLFKILPLHVATGITTTQGRLTGMVFQGTALRSGKVELQPGTEKQITAPLFISSIGSVPAPIPGVPLRGEIFEISDDTCCRLAGYDHVFALGNAVTGRGNIRESLLHGREISKTVADSYLFEPEETLRKQLRKKETAVGDNVNTVVNNIYTLKAPDEQQKAAIMQRVRHLQHTVGYDGNYQSWIQAHLPIRLEQQLGLVRK